jgi:hypothetical protein
LRARCSGLALWSGELERLLGLDLEENGRPGWALGSGVAGLPLRPGVARRSGRTRWTLFTFWRFEEDRRADRPLRASLSGLTLGSSVPRGSGRTWRTFFARLGLKEDRGTDGALRSCCAGGAG